MKKILVTLTSSRACSRSTKRTSSFCARSIAAFAAVLCCTICISAQETQEARNKTFNITLGDIEYAHHNDELSAGEAIGKILTGAVTGKTSVEATKYEEDVKSAIISGLSGEEARIEVGKLKIDDVEGDEISRCKVQSGAKEIKSLLEAGESLVVISID